VGALEQIAKPFQHETQMVAQQVERMYIGFQFQDRISQMMALLESDMVRLQEALVVHDAAVPELKEWLTQLESRYAMAEQREDHLDAKGDLSKTDSNETTFF
jgi:methyl-accepting chemotaxis protein